MRSVRDHLNLPGNDDAPRTHIVRVAVQSDQLVIELTKGVAPKRKRNKKCAPSAVAQTPSTRRREILLSESVQPQRCPADPFREPRAFNRFDSAGTSLAR
jgi:hypothetical protein